MTALPDVFHALADPTRLALVERLGGGPRSVKELAAPLPMALPSVMKHLRVLERGGLVRSSKAGRVRTYVVEPEAFAAIEDWLSARRAGWERSFDRLEHLLEDDRLEHLLEDDRLEHLLEDDRLEHLLDEEEP